MPTAPIRDILTYYEEAGSGDPLILIMGISGDLQGWAFQVPALSKHFRVISFDNRGAGRTSAPDRPYTIAGMAEDVAALMDHLGIAKAHILGYSMGGYIAQALALAHPDKVDRLILLSTAPGVDGFGRAVVRSLVDIRRSNLSREQFVRAMAPWLYSADLLDDDDRLRRSILNSVNNPYAQQDHAFLRQAEAILGWDIDGRHGDIKQQTLVACGTEDILVPSRNSEKLAAVLPNASLKLLNGGHVGVIEYANEYNAAFLEFLGAAVPA
ncbi:MAG: alpha/beta fold hydrolase [Tepidiformaceae bacterium]